MADDGTGGPVLVGLRDPENVRQLVRTAGDLARLGDGTVRLVTVVVKPYDSPFGVFDDETIVREYAGDSRELLERADAPDGVAVERDIVVARSPTRGLLKAVEESDPSALLVGWRGRSRRSEAVLGTTVDALVERAECDLYVERIGREADGVDSVLLPVAGGPHVEVAAVMAVAIAVRNDARVVVFAVADAETDAAAAREFAAEGHRMVLATDADLPVETVVREAADPTDAIGDAAANHDVVVLGATRRGALRRRLVGSVARRIVKRTDETVILARDAEVVGGPLHRLGGLLRR
ncbi:Nucleotide-binding universal stress protein, UspA family [Halopelagius inordinatus]|uniref:Nucleotide-binding universal stress protein, UspA family n=1 Tax=Halopelagius inordinatus TaxID=553467 RepID=A0A1I2M4F2_9EURY|nr:universal stress protein [Halopelagius inordinatus]SFF85750.1 Nucleotide-binding universal stress protein, UspA family [Halopelagius inordinatus]